MTPPKAKPKPRLWLTRDFNGNSYNLHHLETYALSGVWQNYFAYIPDRDWEAANPHAKLEPGGGPVEITGEFKIIKSAKRKKVSK